MRKHVVHRFAVLLTSLICFVSLSQAQPKSVVEMSLGGYLHLQNDELHDAIFDGGITVEAWVYFDAIPQDGEAYVLFAKPGMFSMTLKAKTPFDQRRDNPLPVGSTVRSMQLFGRTGGGGSHSVISPPFPLGRRIHVGFQLSGSEGWAQCSPIFNGHTSMLSSDRTLAEGSELEIGGLAAKHQDWWRKWVGSDYLPVSLVGRIDELRITRGWLYDDVGDIDSPEEFEADRNTMGLWHFDEPQGAAEYADSSGNGNTLASGGAMAVHAIGRLATLWAAMKQ